MNETDRLKELLARVLGISKESINDETSPDNVDSWDSFNGLMIVSELEREFNLKFTMEEVTSVKNFKDIKKNLAKYGVKADG